ncbi:hypothetical protein KSP40_PGU018795 [Platanthera guangdongensis]|uniref:Tetratricopeptide repeat protein n=1 Tax=Platanthera guangdongensis TaxID=2320717 RepID=A0ABR2LRY0_9ASPA
MRTSAKVDDDLPDAWITLGRTQLNFGEPDLAIQSFDNALEIKQQFISLILLIIHSINQSSIVLNGDHGLVQSDHDEALIDRQTASRLIKRRKQLHSSGLPISDIRYKVGDKDRPAIPLKSLAPEPDYRQQ